MCYCNIYSLITIFTIATNLVERNIVPQGIPLVDPTAVAKSSRQDLTALVAEIEKVVENNHIIFVTFKLYNLYSYQFVFTKLYTILLYRLIAV